jgi:trk system potassium uptake protein TrkH
MSLRPVLNVVGVLLVFLAGAMFVTAGVAAYYVDGDAVAFLASGAITVMAGAGMYYATRFHGDITHRQGYATVTFAWTLVALFGALPFLLTGVVSSPVEALFESMSGFTTTGATVFGDIEALPHGILLWRSVTHWLGGMGIIVLAIAVLPFLGVGGMQLYRAEVPGPTMERLRPRITQTAKLLWYVYVGLTGLQALLYYLGGMSAFDSVNHAFATLATGGFSTKNDSVASFSRYHQYVTLVFMYLAGINFTLHFRAATGRPTYWKNEGWKFFTLIVVAGGLILAVANLLSGGYAPSPSGVEQALRDGLFQSTSITTTTGFVSADYELWVPAAQGLLLTLMFTGGMAGSTGGGVKTMRVLLTLKYVGTQIRKHLHPRAILLTRFEGRAVKEDVLSNVVGFVFLYVVICLLGTMAMTFMGMDLLTAFGASAATVGNIGPGVGNVGATENYGWISDPALAVLAFMMLVGRLEIYTVLLLFHPDMWRRRKGGGRRPYVVRALESRVPFLAGKTQAPSPEVDLMGPDEVTRTLLVEEDEEAAVSVEGEGDGADGGRRRDGGGSGARGSRTASGGSGADAEDDVEVSEQAGASGGTGTPAGSAAEDDPAHQAVPDDAGVESATATAAPTVADDGSGGATAEPTAADDGSGGASVVPTEVTDSEEAVATGSDPGVVSANEVEPTMTEDSAPPPASATDDHGQAEPGGSAAERHLPQAPPDREQT